MDNGKEAAAVASEVEDAMMQNSYPSPSADNPESHFYQLASHREPEMDQHQADQADHHALSSLVEHQQHANDDDSDLRELQALQDPQPSEPHHHDHGEGMEQHENHQQISIDDLRLTAQLSHDLAPIIAAQHLAHQQQLPPGDTNMEDQVDPELQRQLQAELENHDQELHDGLPRAEAPPGSEYAAGSNPSGLPFPQFPVPDNTPPRKRSKVSRACDECRRKKIKCDAQVEGMEQPCSNCKRSNSNCLFSRVPQKRGPSKGYIKELADRINTIEGKLGSTVEALDSAALRNSAEAFPSPLPTDESRKRPYSSISGDGFPTPPSTSARVTWAPDHRSMRTFGAPERATPYSVNDLAPKPITATELADDFQQIPIREGPLILDGIPDGLPQDVLHQDSLHQAEELREVEDRVFNCYLDAIHPTFPVLAGTKARVQSLISQCPSALQDAFCSALTELVRPFLALALQMNGDSTLASAQQLLVQLESEQHPRSAAADLVHFQTTVMMAIKSEHHGIADSAGQVGGSQQLMALGKAVGLGISMKLHLATPDSSYSSELDQDSDDNVALRAWWSLVSFDRWNAIAMGTPTFISNDTAVVLPGLKYVVGDAVYHLLRLSQIIGRFVPLAKGPPADLGAGSSWFVGSLTNGIMEEFRLQFPAELDEAQFPVVHLAYWHTRILSDMFSSQSRLPSILQDCTNIVRLLVGNPQLLGPLNPHFIILSSLVIAELAKVDEAHAQVDKLIKDVLECSIPLSSWNPLARIKLMGVMRTRGEGAGASTKNLHQLADLATLVDPGLSAALKVQQGQDTIPAGSPAIGAQEDGPASTSATNPAPPAVVRSAQENHVDGAKQEFDPFPILKVGYLAWFQDEAKKGAVAT